MPDSLTIEASEATEVTELVRLLKLLKLLRRLKLVRPLKRVKLLELAWWLDKEAGHTLNVNAPVFRPTRPAARLPAFLSLISWRPVWELCCVVVGSGPRPSER